MTFIATSNNSGDFVFTVWFQSVSGEGLNQPIVPDIPDNFLVDEDDEETDKETETDGSNSED